MALFTLAPIYGTQVALPPPPKTFGETLDVIGSTKVTLGGSRIRQLVATRKTWTFAYQWLTDAQYTAVLAYVDGTLGLGPFELRKTGDATVYLVNVDVSGGQVPLVGSRHCTLTMTQV